MLLFLLDFNCVAAETNYLLRSGVEYLDWSPWTHLIEKSTADIDKENYGLAKYSFDFFYNNSRLFYVDYYQPIGSGEKSTYYKSDLSRISVVPVSFLNSNHDWPFLYRVLVSTEYVQENKGFSANISTDSELTYIKLDGQQASIDVNSENVKFDASFQYQEISVDLFAGLNKNTVFESKPSDSNETFIVQKLLNCAEFKIGYFDSAIKRPLGQSDVLNESIIDVKGFLYGFRSRNRGTPGFNIDLIAAYGKGYLKQYNLRQKIDYAHYFSDFWYNLYYKKEKFKMLVTTGVVLEEIEVERDKKDPGTSVIFSDKIYKYYLQAGFLF